MESNNLYTVDAKLQFEFPPQTFTGKNYLRMLICFFNF